MHDFKFDNLSFVPCIVLGLESFGGLFIPFLGSVEQCCRRIEFETDDLKYKKTDFNRKNEILSVLDLYHLKN